MDDDMAVLLQEAVAELQVSRNQTEPLVRQNQQLVEKNMELTDRVKEMMDSASQKHSKPRVVVSVHTKVCYNFFASNRWGESFFNIAC